MSLGSAYTHLCAEQIRRRTQSSSVFHLAVDSDSGVTRKAVHYTHTRMMHDLEYFRQGTLAANRGGGVVALLEGNWRVETIVGAQSWININHTRAAGLFSPSLSLLACLCVSLCVKHQWKDPAEKGSPCGVPLLRRKREAAHPQRTKKMGSAEQLV